MMNLKNIDKERKQKISKDIDDLANIFYERHLIDIYRIIKPKFAEYTFLSNVLARTFIKYTIFWS